MTTRYTQIGEAYEVDHKTLKATAIAIALVTGVIFAISTINALDNQVTRGFLALTIATLVSLGTITAVTAIARWMLVRKEVSNANLQRKNGDRLFKVLATFTAICFGIAAAALALQIFEVNLASEFSAGFFHVKSIVMGVAGKVTSLTHVS